MFILTLQISEAVRLLTYRNGVECSIFIFINKFFTALLNCHKRKGRAVSTSLYANIWATGTATWSYHLKHVTQYTSQVQAWTPVFMTCKTMTLIQRKNRIKWMTAQPCKTWMIHIQTLPNIRAKRMLPNGRLSQTKTKTFTLLEMQICTVAKTTVVIQSSHALTMMKTLDIRGHDLRYQASTE